MSAVKFSKQYVQPKPYEVDYWVDLATNPYGAVIKYYNGDDWERWEGSNGPSSNFDVYNKTQINQMLAKKANVGDVDSKVDDAELAETIKNIQVKEIGNDGIALVLFKYDNTNLAVTLPTATPSNAGVLSGTDYAKFVKQHQLQSLYSEMYDLFADIRSKYQRKLKAGRNIRITSDNVISAEINVGPGSYDAALNELDEKINIETERAIAVEDRLEKRVDQHYAETDNLFAQKANKADVYTKSQVDNKLTGVYKVKGSKTYEKLPTSNDVGDVYNITNQFTLKDTTYPAGTNVVYTEYGWDALSGNFDVTSLEENIQTVADNLSKETLRAINAETYNSNSIVNLTNTTANLTTKLNTLTGNVYTVDQVNNIVNGYLPLSGGTINGGLYLDSGSVGTALGFKTTGGDSWLYFNGDDNTWYVTDIGWNKQYKILHTHNFANHALPLSGGTIKGILEVNGNNATNTPLTVETPSMNYNGYIKFASSGTTSGYLGMGGKDKPVFRSSSDTNYAIWHEGNDGSGSGMDADLLDGQEGSWYIRNVLTFQSNNGTDVNGGKDLNSLTYGLVSNYGSYDCWANAPTGMTYGMVLNLKSSLSNELMGQLAWDINHRGADSTRYLYWRANDDRNFATAKWHQIAFTDSNVASATKLQTPRTIWGQSFNGTMNVNGTLTLPNNNGIHSIDTNGNSNHVLLYSSSNVLNIGGGSAVRGHNTRIFGDNIYFAYSINRVDGIVLNSSGNVGIGTTSPTRKLDIVGSMSLTGGYKIGDYDVLRCYNNALEVGRETSSYQSYSTNIWGNGINFYNKEGNRLLAVTSEGNFGFGVATPTSKLHVSGNILATGTITQESQRDLKDIIDEKVLSLDDMNTINPTRFKWKDGRDEDIHYGGVAEDIQQVIPEVVHKPGDNLTVEYGNAAFVMVASLVKHVKELEQRLSKLEEDYKQLLLSNKQ